MRLVKMALGLAAVAIAVSAFGCLGAPDEGGPAGAVDEPIGTAEEDVGGGPSGACAGRVEPGLNFLICTCCGGGACNQVQIGCVATPCEGTKAEALCTSICHCSGSVAKVPFGNVDCRPGPSPNCPGP